MMMREWLQIAGFFGLVLLLVKPLGSYMAKVYAGETTLLSSFLRPVEKTFYHLAGISQDDEMTWKEYSLAVILFNLAGILFLYLILRIQHLLPFNNAGIPGLSPDLAFNAAVSFVTNTNWQAFSGERSISLLTQMIGFTVQNFLSAATGMAVLVAFIRGLNRKQTINLGNFWVDLTRGVLYILIPLSILLSIFLIWSGSVQTLSPTITVHTLEENRSQLVSTGPVASQVAIKHLGTNGGGFFNANAAHPFENPTPLSNLMLMLAQTAIPFSLTYTYGKMVGDTRQGWSILAAMLILLLAFAFLACLSEAGGNPVIQNQIPASSGILQTMGNMEGKEVRFGSITSALFASITTATSTGAVISTHDSFTPLGGMAALILMQLGEVAPGGVGSGLYGMLVFVLVAVFVAGLMVGRTPEYLGKKIEPFEMKMAALLILIMPILVLSFTALAISTPAGRAGITNPGPHGFSQVLYAFTSQGNNNGSAFAGLNANSVFYNYLGAVAMFISRFWLIVPTLALAGSLAEKKKIPVGAGTLPTTSPLFIGWLVLIVLVVGALNFLPALAIGPIIEHLQMTGF
ncbi:MAG: potassium-transporting ATPase subunit KdpA [Leptolinea sp.]|jgi:K+-transporting ATPase ATPase A chain|nr:potassium-transporting ATPase subunit KdpA [Leptolinea sp.]